MFRSLSQKLILAFILVSVVGALLAVGITRWLSVQEFQQLVQEQTQSNFIELISDYYSTTGNWRGIMQYLREGPRIRLPQQSNRPTDGQNQQQSYIYALANDAGKIIIPARDYRVGDQAPDTDLVAGQPLIIDGQFVGTVLATGDPPPLDPREQDYLDRTNRVLLYAASGATVVALILGVFLARSLSHPLQELTTAIRAMAQGQMGQQVPVRSNDEIGELATTFNQMSINLAKLNEQRRQMTADIAHDLRTPLTVLGGYLEAMQDKVLEPTPDRLETMHTEIQGLIHLVEDLRTLSLADAGQLHLNRQLTAPQNLLERVVGAFNHRAAEKGVNFRLELSSDLVQVSVDPERYHQVLSNLVANALRHTPSGGTITLAAYPAGGQINFAITDTGEGIPADMLLNVFDRFFRGDQAREQSQGETGLGLAIVKSIVEAHRGWVTVSSEGVDQGSKFMIHQPVA
jgi:signal transduction histidine kinase